jgi:hypothetical protein
MYCDINGKIPSVLNNCLQVSGSSYGNYSDYPFLKSEDMDAM